MIIFLGILTENVWSITDIPTNWLWNLGIFQTYADTFGINQYMTLASKNKFAFNLWDNCRLCNYKK